MYSYIINIYFHLMDAIPFRFLVFKDSYRETQVHDSACPHLGQRGEGSFSCQCPFRLAYTTVDSYIGKLRSIFSDIRRQATGTALELDPRQAVL